MGELIHVEHGTMGFLLEDDANLAAALRASVLEEDDGKGSATDAVAGRLVGGCRLIAAMEG